MTLDHPLIRQAHVCPFCSKAKDAGLVACWPCYRAHVKYGEGEHVLDQAEATLSEH